MDNEVKANLVGDILVRFPIKIATSLIKCSVADNWPVSQLPNTSSYIFTGSAGISIKKGNNSNRPEIYITTITLLFIG